MYENKSEDGSDSELPEHSDQTPQRIGFNPMSLPFPSHPFPGSSYPFPGASSLFREMEVCEAYGDLSEEEEEEGDTEEGGDVERKEEVLTGKAIAEINEENNETEVIDAREEEGRPTIVKDKKLFEEEEQSTDTIDGTFNGTEADKLGDLSCGS